MGQELEPRAASSVENVGMGAPEVPIDLTVHRPKTIGVYGRFALTKTKITLSPRGHVDRMSDDPDALTVDGSVTIEGPTRFRISVQHPEVPADEPLHIENHKWELEK